MKDIPIISYTSQEGKDLFARIEAERSARDTVVEERVNRIFEEIAAEKDAALFACCRRFDQRTLTGDTLCVSREEISRQAARVAPKLQETIRVAAERIEAYHARQVVDTSFSMETAEGTLSQRVLPLKRVALYIPGGYTVYPSTVLMNGIPARLAGVEEIVALTPCRNGELAPEIAFVLEYLGITTVYQMGGAHGVAALALGTESVAPVDKIVGPGNAYVAAAKKQAYGRVDIDSIAGPSEIAILADACADPHWMALDLLSQAEHGSGDETALFVTEDRALVTAVHAALLKAMEESPTRSVFENLSDHAIVLVHTASRSESYAVLNNVGPEHLEIVTEDPAADLEHIYTAAAVFLGPYTPVPLGDYFVGTNHVLPTGGAGRYASPLGVPDFQKRISVAEVHAAGLKQCAPHVSRFARAEKFIHHAMTVEARTGYSPEQSE
ncbi:histidinol dehydrogenase [Chitinivibrio alkaliphilus]|uniref:Histidinol dehydrogenase n=1 Tax=Chitinivibrio alkaliphilus ACht1 TaxID=1313304 RepID=U7D7J1_9BACT|nr:histidinol dehydrogenase [Chitinivibrio alkaliphilus]ERP31898.1 histidinol dehydrogenase [Chitinivibrio alkaliphilus ACht1]